MKKAGIRNQRGISLIETLIVLVVIGILIVFAVMKFGTAGKNLDRQNIAREFKVMLERARFDSVKRRASVCEDMSGVTVNTTSFSLMMDMDQSGDLIDTEVRTIDLANRSDVTIVPNGIELPLTIRFDQRGQAYLNDCDPASTPTADIPLLYFCGGECTPETANGSNSNVIFVSPAGTVAMLTGGETMPTFANANVTAVPNNTYINRLLSVWNPIVAASPSPSVSPNPSPSPSPSVSPTPTPIIPLPTISPLPSVTPIPNPTPVACPTSAPWGSPPVCTCMSPQTVRGNGMCK